MRTLNTNKTDLKKIRIHNFRHSCASLLINNGANVTLVAKYLGHAKIKEKLNTYSHMFSTTLDSIVYIMIKI
ncbi:MAG: tyrosine-type recombinase/integrase [Bacilli bacterium]